MQKVIDVNTYCVQTNEEFRNSFLEDVGNVAQTHWELLILVLAPLGEDGAQFFIISSYINMVVPHIYI